MRHNNPLVSILVPYTRDNCDGLSQTMESLLDQNYDNIELRILVKGNKILFPELTTISQYGFHKDNVHITYLSRLTDDITDGFMRYTLATIAKGKYSMFLEPGDGICNNSISRSVDLLETYSDYGGLLVSYKVSDNHYRSGVCVTYKANIDRVIFSNTNQYGAMWLTSLIGGISQEHIDLIMDLEYTAMNAILMLIQETQREFLLSGHVAYVRKIVGKNHHEKSEHRIKVLDEMMDIMCHIHDDKILIKRRDFKRRIKSLYRTLLGNKSSYEWIYGSPKKGIIYSIRRLFVTEKNAVKYVRTKR